MKHRKLLKLIFSFLLVFSLLGAFNTNAGAHSEPTSASGGLIDQLNANLRKQEELRKKIAEAQAKERTLSNEIAYLENQINLTKLQIEETQTRLQGLASDITVISGKLDKTKKELQFTSDVANLRLRSIYKQSFSGVLDSFLGAASFNDFLSRQKYTEAIRAKDLELINNLEALKTDYQNQKTNLEDKKKKEEELKNTLVSQHANLKNQEGSRRYLLAVTKNSEDQYKRLLAQVQSEIAAISRALGGGGVRLGPVKKGDVIAFQGNTGCSTGSHLHFGLYVNGVAKDPKPYLDSSDLRWPLANPTVTQWFGENYWWYMRYFGLPGHNGIDMTQYDGAPILAAADGVAYLATDSSACRLTGTVGKGIVIHHPNGWKTIYWHIK